MAKKIPPPEKAPTAEQKLTANRLKEERQRLGLSAEAAAEAGGVSRATQFAYEAATRTPDTDYLFGLWKAGADVMWVVTGQRHRADQRLAAPDRELLDKLSQLPAPMRQLVDQVALLAYLAHQARRDEQKP